MPNYSYTIKKIDSKDSYGSAFEVWQNEGSRSLGRCGVFPRLHWALEWVEDMMSCIDSAPMTNRDSSGDKVGGSDDQGNDVRGRELQERMPRRDWTRNLNMRKEMIGDGD